MRRVRIIALAIVVVGFIAGCAPTITVTNGTKMPVRAIVGAQEHGNVVISAAPGKSADVEAAEGRYGVFAIADTVWMEDLKDIRRALVAELADPENINGPALMRLIEDLQKITDKIDQLERAAKHGSMCYGDIASDQDVANANITTDPTGALLVSCQ